MKMAHDLNVCLDEDSDEDDPENVMRMFILRYLIEGAVTVKVKICTTV